MHEGERLRRFFESGFTAADLAEPLVSFDEDAPARLVCGTLERRRRVRSAGVPPNSIWAIGAIWPSG